MKTWNFSTEIEFDISADECGTYADSTKIPQEVAKMLLPLLDVRDKVLVKFDVVGSISYGCWYMSNGDPGYPDEEDEERTITVIDTGECQITFEDKEFAPLFHYFEDLIYDYEIDYPPCEDDAPLYGNEDG